MGESYCKIRYKCVKYTLDTRKFNDLTKYVLSYSVRHPIYTRLNEYRTLYYNILSDILYDLL